MFSHLPSFTIRADDQAQSALDAGALGDGRLLVVPSAFYAQFDQEQLSVFCVRHGFYCLPTVELLNVINSLILEASPTRNAIEIGSGNGAIARGLGIIGTDSYQQDAPEMQLAYASMAQPTVTYGADVQRLNAFEAVKTHKPEVVVAAWVTHRYHEKRHKLGGNAEGVDEFALLRRIRRYVFVGNMRPHKVKPLLDVRHKTLTGDFLYSRSPAEFNVLKVWDSKALR